MVADKCKAAQALMITQNEGRHHSALFVGPEVGPGDPSAKVLCCKLYRATFMHS